MKTFKTLTNVIYKKFYYEDDTKELEEKIRKGREKDYIVIMFKAGKEFSRIDYSTEKEAYAAIRAGKFFGSAGMTFKLEKDGKSLKV